METQSIETRWYCSRLKMQLLLKGYKLMASWPRLQFLPAGKERGFFLVKKPVVYYERGPVLLAEA